MVPKKSRLPREGFASGGHRTIRTPYFSLKVKKTTLKANRIGVVIGKAVDKRATRRNFLKRQAKTELLKLPHLGNDLILMIYPKANALTKAEFIKEIKKAISQSAAL